MAQNNPLIWIDLEMTGLEPKHDRIIEIATIITNDQLEIIAEGPVFAIKQSNELLEGMDDWNQKQHGSSGLLTRVKESNVTEQVAEKETIKFLEKYVPAGKSPMCGNSIWQDRRFLANGMPLLENYFHYRMVDVTTLKELALRWAPEIYNGFQKKSKHLALDDIKDSIDELKYYRKHFLKF